jgi:glucosamine-6-phosphate deaminase
MRIEVFATKMALGQAAANDAANAMRDAIAQRGEARIIAATGASQFEFLKALTAIEGIEWDKVEMFHLDEYVGLSEEAPASFCRYLRQRLIDKVGLKRYHLLDGTRKPSELIAEVTKQLRKAPIDIAFAGVGENGHLAFNDPPADFDTTAAYMVVQLDDACRRQQLGEGWFPTFEDVPREAISMTVHQLMAAKKVLVMVPDSRKAKAVEACFAAGVSPLAPASILQKHPHAIVYLDKDSASLLSAGVIEKYSA